jgi:hypothetical protein
MNDMLATIVQDWFFTAGDFVICVSDELSAVEVLDDNRYLYH